MLDVCIFAYVMDVVYNIIKEFIISNDIFSDIMLMCLLII